jgi:hypothetical protein
MEMMESDPEDTAESDSAAVTSARKTKAKSHSSIKRTGNDGYADAG